MLVLEIFAYISVGLIVLGWGVNLLKEFILKIDSTNKEEKKKTKE